MTSTLKDESLDPKRTFEIYYDFSEKIKNMQGYRTLALNRGKNWAFSKSDSSTIWIGSFVFLRLVLKPKMPMWMRVIQQAVKKKIVPAIERPDSDRVDGGGRRRGHSIVL